MEKIESTLLAESEYRALYAHVRQLPLVLLISSPRAGTDFFHSLLDGHPEIIQQPGAYDFYAFWDGAQCKSDIADLANEFVWSVKSGKKNQITKFKSKYNIFERWDQLGENRDESFSVEIERFKAHLCGIMHGIELTAVNFFYGYHLAYSLAAGRDVSDTKILFFHRHTPKDEERFYKEFGRFDIIFTTRDPRNSMVSEMNRMLSSESHYQYVSMKYYDKMRRCLTIIESLKSYDLWVIKLEDLKEKPEVVLKAFAARYGLEWDSCMLKSSYMGKQWWGDVQTSEYLDTFSRKVIDKQWSGKWGYIDDKLLQSIFYPRLKSLGYNVKSNFLILTLSPFLILIPTRYERLIMGKILFSGVPMAKIGVLSVKAIYYYILRVKLYAGAVKKRFLKKMYIPTTFPASNDAELKK